MRSRNTTRARPATVTSLIGCAAVLLGLIPAGAVAAGTSAAEVTTAHRTAAVQGVRDRLRSLDREADAAGVAAQIADEALLQHATDSTRHAASRAHDALASLAARQTPALTRLVRRMQALQGPDAVQDAQEGGAATATAAALVGRTRAVRAVSFAREQIGDPYGFAKAGPGSWDCSGLTLGSYSAVHVAVGGHSATAQWRRAQQHHRLVAYRHRQRGDLIFYGRPGSVYHVAIYAGHDRMIEAPYPGKRVREVPVRSADRLSEVARPTR